MFLNLNLQEHNSDSDTLILVCQGNEFFWTVFVLCKVKQNVRKVQFKVE